LTNNTLYTLSWVFNGIDGNDGNDGSNGGRWTYYSGVTAPADPNSSQFATDDGWINATSVISISRDDWMSVNWYTWLSALDTVDNGGNTVYLKLTEYNNNTIIGIFEVGSVVDNTTYFDINIASVLVADSGTWGQSSLLYSISWVFNGLNGTSGTSGLLSLTGTTDNGLITLNSTAPNGTVESNLTFDGSTLAVTGTVSVSGGYRFTHNPLTVLSAPGGYGDIVTVGNTSTLATFSTYFFSPASYWTITDADAASTATGLVAMALGDAPSKGMLLRGYVENTSWSWTVGGALYLSTLAGNITQTAPTGTLDIIRIVGYALSSNTIYWCPDNTWIEI
jgi:hypothetical protein